MLVSIILILYCYGKEVVINNFKENKVLWFLSAIVIYSMFIFLIFDHRVSQLRSWSFSLLFLMFLPKKLLTKKLFYGLVFLGSCFVISYAIWFSFVQGLGRSWPVNVIPFSTFSAVLSIFSFILFFFEDKKSFKFILLVSFLISICSIVIGQSRGVWIALIITIFISLFILVSAKRVSYKSLAIFLIVILGAVAVAYPKIDQRVNSTIIEYEKVQKGDYYSSMGLRIKMWTAAIELSTISPFFGLRDEHLTEFKKMYTSSVDPNMQVMKNYTPPHYHMEILNTFVKAGFIGLLFFLLPMFYVVMCFRKTKNLGSCLAIAMLSIYLIAGLTDIPLTHGNHILFFWMLLFYLINNKEFDEKLFKG
jgi:O-antigen ligase